MRVLLRWVWIPVIAAVLVVLDQWTKGLVEANVPLNGGFAPIPSLAKYLNIVHFGNTGAAFGLFRGQGGILATLALVVIIAVLAYSRFLPVENWPIRVAIGIQLGGAIGNLIDRLQNGHVTDFLLLSLPVGGRTYQWPAFNVADSCIVVGTILLGILLFLSERTAVQPSEVPQPDSEKP